MQIIENIFENIWKTFRKKSFIFVFFFFSFLFPSVFFIKILENNHVFLHENMNSDMFCVHPKGETYCSNDAKNKKKTSIRVTAVQARGQNTRT